jgi:thiamine biosynthesis lipoprotein
MTGTTYQRRARPLLGTLVEIGLPWRSSERHFDAAFAAVQAVQASLSRFDRGSDLAQLHVAQPGTPVALSASSARVLRVAQVLREASDGVFDISLGSGPKAWRLDRHHVWRDDVHTRLDAGGIAKGHAVDRAVRVLRMRGCAVGWVNAGGDMRCFGDLTVPLVLRDDAHGGVREWGRLADGAVATSYFGPGSRSRLHGAVPAGSPCQVVVMAPRCIWADALTKVVAATGDLNHPLLRRLGAQAYLHAGNPPCPCPPST